MAQRLEGKVAVITGGSSGIVWPPQSYLSRKALTFSSLAVGKANWMKPWTIGRNVTPMQSDVSNSSDLDRLYGAVREQKGKLDIVFANAGIGEFARLGEITEEHFEKQFNVNVKGLLFTVQKALPLLVADGSIVLNASIAGTNGTPALSVYGTTKAAVRSFARTWCVDLKERKMRVNAISPGIVPTPGYNTLLGMTQEQVDEYLRNSAGIIPLGRAGSVDEIAKAVLFLASEESSYVNGIELFVDGGLAQI